MLAKGPFFREKSRFPLLSAVSDRYIDGLTSLAPKQLAAGNFARCR